MMAFLATFRHGTQLITDSVVLTQHAGLPNCTTNSSPGLRAAPSRRRAAIDVEEKSSVHCAQGASQQSHRILAFEGIATRQTPARAPTDLVGLAVQDALKSSGV